MKVVTARCIEPPKQVTTKHGERLVSKHRDSQGNDHSIWSPVDHEFHSAVRQGQTVRLGVSSNGKTSLLEEAVEEAAGWSCERKKRMARTVEDSAKLLRFAYDRVCEQFEGVEIEPSDLRALATTCAIEAMRGGR